MYVVTNLNIFLGSGLDILTDE